MRIYVPAGVAMLRALAESGELKPAGPVHAVTRALRSAFPDADVEDLEYTAFDDAALSSLALGGSRRAVVSADVPDRLVTEHPEGTGADFGGVVRLPKVAAIHVDDAEAAELFRSMPDEADPSALEAHLLDWYAPSELGDLLRSLTEHDDTPLDTL